MKVYFSAISSKNLLYYLSFLTDSALGTKIQKKDFSWHTAHVGAHSSSCKAVIISLWLLDGVSPNTLFESSSEIRKVGLRIPETICQPCFWKCCHGEQTAARGEKQRRKKREEMTTTIFFFKHQWNGSHETKCPGEVSHFIFVTALGSMVLYGPFYSDENRGRKHPINYPKSHRGLRAKLRCRECFDCSTLSQTLWGESTRRWVLWECVGKPQSTIPSSQHNLNNKLKL